MTATEDTGHGLIRHGGRKLSDYFVFNTDHKVIGIQYMVLSFLFFIFGGILAELIRAELARPGTQFVGGSTYNQLFTIHGTVMIFLWIIPRSQGWQLRHPAADRRQRHGVPEAERAGVLAADPGGILLLVSFYVAARRAAGRPTRR